jgi:hypothetical protein
MPTREPQHEPLYLCFGNDPLDGQLYDHVIKAMSQDHARRRHFDIHGFYPARIKLLGSPPTRELRSKLRPKSKYSQRKTVTLPVTALTRRTTSRWRGVHQGWVVYASGIASCIVDGVKYLDNELVDITFDHPVKEGIRRPTRRLDQVVRLVSVTARVELD